MIMATVVLMGFHLPVFLVLLLIVIALNLAMRQSQEVEHQDEDETSRCYYARRREARRFRRYREVFTSKERNE
jgi:hypothetical protein